MFYFQVVRRVRSEFLLSHECNKAGRCSHHHSSFEFQSDLGEKRNGVAEGLDDDADVMEEGEGGFGHVIIGFTIFVRFNLNAVVKTPALGHFHFLL